jgi:hypothetical protein
MPGVAGGVVFVVVVLELINEHFDISLFSSKSISTVGRVTVTVAWIGTPITEFALYDTYDESLNLDTLPERLGIVTKLGAWPMVKFSNFDVRFICRHRN